MHDVRLLSVKHFTFRLIYKTRGISGVRIFKFRVRGIPQVLDPLRSGSALMTCTLHLRTPHGPAVSWFHLGGTHSARASQVYMRYKALMRGPLASAEKKNCGAESVVERDPVRKTLAAGVYRPCE